MTADLAVPRQQPLLLGGNPQRSGIEPQAGAQPQRDVLRQAHQRALVEGQLGLGRYLVAALTAGSTRPRRGPCRRLEKMRRDLLWVGGIQRRGDRASPPPIAVTTHTATPTTSPPPNPQPPYCRSVPV